MKEMDILEIITKAGEAKNGYLQAIQEAKAGNYEACNEYVRNGNEAYAKAHRIHMEMVQQEAGGNRVFPKQKDIKKQPMFTCLQTKEYCY